MSGTRVEAELHGKVRPPQVSAIATEVELPMKIKLPLHHTLFKHYVEVAVISHAYIQSIRESFDLMVPGGVFSFKQKTTRMAERPQIGRFMSRKVRSLVWLFRIMGILNALTEEPSPLSCGG